MEDKLLKKIKRRLEDVIDGRDDLLQNSEELVSTANFQVQEFLNNQVSPLQKEALLLYLAKALALFTDLNHSLSKFVKTEPLPKIPENVQKCQEQRQQGQSPPIQDLSDFFKTNCTFDFSTSGPEVSNNQVLNDTYDTKPLHDTSPGTVDELKPVLINKIDGNNIGASNTIDSVKRSNTTTSLIQEHSEANEHTSPTFTESEVFSIVSSVAYQHPLTKYQPPTDVPKQEDIEQIKENLIFLSKKMGFTADKINQMQNQYCKDISKPNFEYEEPVQDVKEKDMNKPEENNCEHRVCVVTSPENTEANQNVSGDPIIKSNLSVSDGPSTNTGAIRKQNVLVDDLIEFSPSVSDSDSCAKVTTWLNNSCLETNISENLQLNRNSAIDKLTSVKRYDRNEEAREQARKDMPDIKFIPVEVPKVIKNDLHSDSSTERKSDGKRKKVKDLNRATAVYEIKTMELPEEGAVCVFSHIVSPSEFYLQIVTETSTACLDEITEKLDAKFKKSPTVFNTKLEAFERVGKFCCGYIFDDKRAWYRLQVIDWELGRPSSEVEVKSVDFGFRCRTSFQFLRPLSADLADVPTLAIQCHFPLLYPPRSTYCNKLTEWPEVTIESLHNMASIYYDTDPSNFKLFQITLAMLEGDSVAVDLVPYNELDSESLSNTLLDVGLAVEFVEDYGEHEELGEFLEDIAELETAENLAELVQGYDAKDEARICRFTRRDGTCYKGKNCKLEHVTLKDGYTTDKVTAFYTAYNELIFPSKGETVQVLVTAYRDSCTYLVQIVRNPVKKESMNLVMDRDLSDLMDNINHPKKTSKYEHFKVYPAVGEVILAYSPWKLWIRAVVRELKFDGCGKLMDIDVYAVDFGDQFTVKFKDIRVVSEDFLHVPFQVTQIYLDNYQHRRGCDAAKAKKFFQKHILYRTFLIHVKSKTAPLKVSMTTFKGRDIGPTLIKEGFSEKRTMDIQIAEDCKMDLY